MKTKNFTTLSYLFSSASDLHVYYKTQSPLFEVSEASRAFHDYIHHIFHQNESRDDKERAGRDSCVKYFQPLEMPWACQLAAQLLYMSKLVPWV